MASDVSTDGDADADTDTSTTTADADVDADTDGVGVARPPSDATEAAADAGKHGFAPAQRLRERERRDLRRTLTVTDAVTARARHGGTETIVLASNNYLGLAGDDRVRAGAVAAAEAVGTGAGASRLLTGDTPAHRRLETALATAKATERALAFSSGYAANVGTIAALAPDVVFSDALNHASIVDGCRLCGGETVVYDHCDADALAAAMRERERATGAEPNETAESWLVVTDSVFSMDGDVAPLKALATVAERHGAWLMVDEAHATGVFDGGDGGGVVGARGLSDRVQIQLGTLSKALASQGGFVAGSDALIEHLVNAARTFVFSTGLAPPAAGAARTALQVAETSDRPARLHATAARLREGLTALGYTVAGDSHILPVMIGDREAALALAAGLRERGIVAPAIRPPTVPDGTSRLRLAPMATHTDVDVDACLAAFETLADRLDGVTDGPRP